MALHLTVAWLAVALGLFGCVLCKVPTLCSRCLVTKGKLTFSVLSLRTVVQCDDSAFSLLLFFLSRENRAPVASTSLDSVKQTAGPWRGHFSHPLLSGRDCRFEDHRRSGGPGSRASLPEDSVVIPFPFRFPHLSPNRSTWRAEAQANQSEYHGACLFPHLLPPQPQP